jgi:hypothetical protein
MMESVWSGLKGQGLQEIGRWQKGAREKRRGIEVPEKGDSGDRRERRVGEPEGANRRETLTLTIYIIILYGYLSRKSLYVFLCMPGGEI